MNNVESIYTLRHGLEHHKETPDGDGISRKQGILTQCRLNVGSAS